VYADDLNIVCAFSVDGDTHSNIEQGTSAIRDWYLVNGLLLNPQKSEVLVVGTGAQVRKLKIPASVAVAWVALEGKKVVTLLGVQIDLGLTMDKFVNSKISAKSHHLRALRKLRPALSRSVAESVGRSIVLYRLDYCNSLLHSANSGNLDMPQ